MIEFAPLLDWRRNQHVEDSRRPAHVRDAMLDDHRKDQSGIDLAQADMRTAHGHHRPREAPAVAMEHRQGPQIDGFRRHRPGHDVSDGLEKSAAMVIDHALRVSGRAGCVVERDRVAFVGWRRPCEPGIALGDEVLVLERSEPLAGPRIQFVGNVDDERALFQFRQSRTDLRGKFPVGDQHLGLTMLQDIGDGCRIEARVDGVEYGAQHRHAVVRLDHRRHIGEHRRYRVAAPNAGAWQAPRPVVARDRRTADNCSAARRGSRQRARDGSRPNGAGTKPA